MNGAWFSIVQMETLTLNLLAFALPTVLATCAAMVRSSFILSRHERARTRHVESVGCHRERATTTAPATYRKLAAELRATPEEMF